MLKYTILFLLAAIISGVLGFDFLDGMAATIAKVLFGFSLVLVVVSLLYDRSAKYSEI